MNPSLSHRPLRPLAFALALSLGSLTLSAPSFAQDTAESEKTGIDMEDEEESSDGALEAAKPESESDAASVDADAAEAGEPKEKKPKGNVQLLIGARYRAMVVPKGLINAFGLDGGRTMFRSGVGGEIGGYFGKTADGFLLMGSVWWMGYGLKPTPFKGSKDPDTSWEIAQSSMGAMYMSLDTMWDHKIMDRLSFAVGGSFGVGIVTGKLYRNEAYVDNVSGNPSVPAAKDWPNLSYCPIGGNNTVQCPPDGNYGEAKRWPVYPWINFQVGLRYQPIDKFVARFDMGLGSSGVWFGLGADYSIFL